MRTTGVDRVVVEFALAFYHLGKAGWQILDRPSAPVSFGVDVAGQGSVDHLPVAGRRRDVNAGS